MPDEFLTVAEVADLLKVNEQTVRNWIDRGELSAVRVGARRVRVRRTDLDAFMTASEAETPAPPLVPEPPSPAEVAARTRLKSASKAVSSARKDEALIAALLELSDATRALAETLRR